MQAFLNSKVGAFVVGTGWAFFLTALGYGLFTGKVDYTFFGPVVTAILGVFGYHFVATKGPGKNGNGGAPGA
jgi:uncharacterized membrane protein